MKIKYPRYTREQSLACKLTDKDIKEIRRLNKLGLTRKEIAKIFNVSRTLVSYWLLSNEARKARNRRQYLLYDKSRDIKDKYKRQLRSINRKYRIMPTFRKYKRQWDK